MKTNEEIQIINYAYENNPIQFMINDSVMISATKMAKPFGENKKPAFWLKTQQANEFINELSKLRKSNLTDLVQVRYGGLNPGTWFHEDVALEFARWLAPAFAIWCNDRIKEILLARANGRAYPEHAVYPGSMTPTNCAVLTCHTVEGHAKQLYLMWGDDTWFQNTKWNGDREIRMRTIISGLGQEDKDTVSYERDAFSMRDGRWIPSPFKMGSIDKRPKKENVLTKCEQAIDKYRKARDEVKLSAQNVVEYMDA